jgi:predicted nucleic acid-binding protein
MSADLAAFVDSNSPWDAAILESARQAGCKKVISEDLNAGQLYGAIRVENPFSALTA